MPYDLIIVGAGPAGLTAAIYARRALLEILILEKGLLGGKLNKTADVENYPGFTKIKGPELAEEMTKHVRSYDNDVNSEETKKYIYWKNEEVIQLTNNKKIFEVKTEKDGNYSTYFSKAVIIASGTIENKLNVPGEEEFTNFGVSYCAICDGFAFRDKAVAVIGGGYSAFETALYLSDIAKKVYLIHRRDIFRAEKAIVERAKNDPKITFFLNAIPTEIKGEGEGQEKKVKKIIISQPEGQKELAVRAVFPCIGLLPYSQFAHQLDIRDQKYILIKEDCSTSVPGLFAAGDVARSTEKKIKQIVTAISEGAVAAQSVIEYLKQNYIKE